MASLEQLADVFNLGAPKEGDWTTLGKVSAVNPDGSLTCYLSGSASPSNVADYCGAQAGDVTLVLVSKGKARAIAIQGGSGGGASGDVDWTQSTYADGYYMRRGKTVTVVCESYGSITAPNGSYATVFTLPEGFRPVLPAGKSLYGAASTLGGSYPVTWRIESDGKVSVGGNGTSTSYWAFSATFPCE